MKRVFVAIDISDEARRKAADRIAAFAAKYSSSVIKWVQAEKLHLTVRFLGDVSEHRLQSVIAAAGNACGKITRFGLVLERPGVFPSPKKASVLWIGVRDESGMSGKLKGLLDREFRHLEIRSDDNAFKPHLTLARIKDPVLTAPIIRKHLQEGFEPVAFSVEKIVVYESRLLPSGPIYSKLESFDLRSP